MKYLFEAWSDIVKKIESARHILLLFDYDGTLTPIMATPKEARLNNKTRLLLDSMAKSKRLTVGIISGRSLKEIEDLVKLKEIYYGGNHGLEIRGPRFEFVHPSYIYVRPLLKDVYRYLREKLEGIKGVIIENKGLTLSLHYRLVRGKDVAKVKAIFDSVVQPYLKSSKVVVTSGKKVLEIRPPLDWDKGRAIKLIRQLVASRRRLKVLSLFSIYLGDDRTDEDAFRALGERGISVYVGKEFKDSQARFFLRNTTEVESFLRRLNLNFTK